MTHSLAHPELHREFRGLIIVYDPDEGTTIIGGKKIKPSVVCLLAFLS